MELAIACVLQLKERFLHAQMPLLLDALRPLCWSTVSVEAALQCLLRLLHGCYHEPHPYWTAGPREGALAQSGDDPSHEEAELPRYGTPMHPAEDLRACLERLTQLRNVLFPGWQSSEERKPRFPLPAFVRRCPIRQPPWPGSTPHSGPIHYGVAHVTPICTPSVLTLPLHTLASHCTQPRVQPLGQLAATQPSPSPSPRPDP